MIPKHAPAPSARSAQAGMAEHFFGTSAAVEHYPGWISLSPMRRSLSIDSLPGFPSARFWNAFPSFVHDHLTAIPHHDLLPLDFIQQFGHSFRESFDRKGEHSEAGGQVTGSGFNAARDII